MKLQCQYEDLLSGSGDNGRANVLVCKSVLIVPKMKLQCKYKENLSTRLEDNGYEILPANQIAFTDKCCRTKCKNRLVQ